MNTEKCESIIFRNDSPKYDRNIRKKEVLIKINNKNIHAENI